MSLQPQRPRFFVWLTTVWVSVLTVAHNGVVALAQASAWLRVQLAGWRRWGPNLFERAQSIWAWLQSELPRWQTWAPRLSRWSQAKALAAATWYRVQTPARKALVALLLFVTILTGPTGTVLVRSDFGQRLLGIPTSIRKPTYNPTQSQLHLPPSPPISGKPGTSRPPMPHGFSALPKEVAADPAGVTFLSDDGRFEADVPAGAVTAQDLAGAAGHQEKLRVTQFAPASGGTAGGSGLISFGSYLVELVDGNGKRVSHGFHKPVAILLHYASQEDAFNLEHAFVVFNGAHPKTITGLGAHSSAPLTLDRVNRTLSTQISIDLAFARNATFESHGNATAAAPMAANTSTSTNPWGLSFNSTSPVAKFVNPDPFNVDLSSGSLTTDIPLDLPAGPAGHTPPLKLAYNSGGVSEQHNPQGAAGWVGEGWNLSLGAITWSERDYNSLCSGCTQKWQNQWFLSDPFGTSTELLPPATTTSTYYDDTGNPYCAQGNSAAQPCPIQFHTADESHAKVYAYVGGNNYGDTNATHTLCFRVYLANGIMEEFGCSLDSVHYDSLQYYVAGLCLGSYNCNSTGYYLPSTYYPDLITFPTGDQIHITYQSDTQQDPSAVGTGGGWYPRDTVLNTVEWDSPDCVNASQACTGGWHPHYRVQFNASHSVARVTNTPAYACNTATSVRCDDPMNLTGSGTIPAPKVNSTLVLNDFAVQTNMSGNGSGYNSSAWNTVRDYQLGYEENGPHTITDPVTGNLQSVAGYLDLTRIQQVGTDGNPANGSPLTTFGYNNDARLTTEYYEDGTLTPPSGVGCGPTWNTGGNGNPCDLWEQSYDSNSRYLNSIDNHLGQVQTVSWNNARSNTHGANSGSALDPFACVPPLPATYSATYPCNEADDQQWSRIVVGERDLSVQQVTQQGQGGAQTSKSITGKYQYTYQLVTYTSTECYQCNQGFYWGDENSNDYLDFYSPHFAGFAQTTVSKPDGSLEYHHFYASEGWGVYDASLFTGTNKANCTVNVPPYTYCRQSSWWDLQNVGHGREYEADYYDTNGTTLLRKVTNQYQAICPPPGGATGWNGKQASELSSQSNPVVGCDVQLQQTTAVQEDGAADSASPSSTVAYTYDGYGRVTQTVTTGNGGTASGSPQSITSKTTYIQNDGLTLPSSQISNTVQESAWGGIYLLDATAASETFDPNGNKVGCAYTSYDGAAYTTGQQGSLIHGNPTQQDRYTACATSGGRLSTKASFDAYGNPVTTTDANNNTGCTANGVSATTCIAYGTVTLAQPTSAVNTLNQAATTSYDASAAGGFGLWPVATTDPNNQTSATTYDVLGRVSTMRLPGQTTGVPSTQLTYTFFPGCSGAQTVCYEADAATRTDSATQVTQRRFYDGASRLVETRTPAPGGMDTVTYTLYDVSGRAYQTSEPYFVPAYTGAPGSAAYSIPDASVLYTQTLYDGLNRVTQVQDPLKQQSNASYHAVCNAAGTNGDAACYSQALRVDANGHQQSSLTDGLGRAIYSQDYTGNSSATYAVYRTTKTTYDTLGRTVAILHPDGTHSTTFTYDTAGRLTAMSDPDRGSESYNYDANSNVTQTVDARGAVGTIYAGYDGLNRQLWRNTTNSATGAYASYSYDSTANGNVGVGHLTGESFTGGLGASLNGSYANTYDRLGRLTQQSQTTGNVTNCPSGWSCADVGSTSIAGNQFYSSAGVWTLQASGNDIYGTADSFHLVSQPLAGDGTLSATVSTQTVTDDWAKAGLMMRATTDAGSPFYDVVVTPGNGLVVEYRTTLNGPSTDGPHVATTTTPIAVQITRAGTTFSVATSTDGGVTWTPLANSSVTIPALSGTLLQGMATTSHSNGKLGAVTFAHVSLSTAPPTPAPATTTNTTAYSYNDAGQPLSQTYANGDVVTTSYDPVSGWSDQLSVLPSGASSASNLLTNEAYSGAAGALGLLTSATLGGFTGGATGSFTASYDPLGRPTDRHYSYTPSGGTARTLYEVQPTYDAVSNVTGVTTTLPQGVDTQAFCYDEQNRLTWAGSTGTPTCSGTPTPSETGSLVGTGAAYSASYAYDTLNRLTSSPLGVYTYGDSAHLHAATAIGPSGGTATWTTTYDAAGNTVCRAPSSVKTCAGTTPNGPLLTWDNEGRLTAWQNPAYFSGFNSGLEEALYDGEGQRVQQIDTSSGTHTTTQHTYVGGTEDLASQWANAGGAVTTTTTAYYGGVAESVNGALSYSLSDGLGSVSASVNSSGTVSATQLYGPYGAARYHSGTLPTDYAFTHQRADATSGLDYYGARYYDPVAGQFSSADTTLAGGLNRYGYVGGNPETLVDPSGHAEVNSGAMLTRGLTEEQTTLFLAGLAAIFAAGVKAVQDWQAIQPAPPIATSPRWARHQSNTMAAWNASVPGSSNAINRGGWIADGYSGSSASSGAQPSRSADVTTTETAAGTAPESEPQPADSGRGARQGGGGRWLYHGTRAKFDRFDVSAAIANQAGRTLELGPGIYLTDDPARAYEYAGGDKRIAFIYRAWVPDALLAQFPTSIISTNTSPQWVITHQADAEVLNETIQRITAIDWWLRNPWRNEP